MIIGITGLTIDRVGRASIAGSGKDTVAARLVEKHGFTQVSLADPMKRFCKDVFKFTDDQLWGPSEKRNMQDTRYTRGHDVCLTPRYALQRLGTDWGRDCHEDVWVDYALKVAGTLLCLLDDPYKRQYTYDPKFGLIRIPDNLESQPPQKGIVIPDLRFTNEFRRIREAGGRLWRVKRCVGSIPEELGEGHLSERELLTTPDKDFDAILPNDHNIDHLYLLVDAVMDRYSGRIIDYDDNQKDIPPFKRE